MRVFLNKDDHRAIQDSYLKRLNIRAGYPVNEKYEKHRIHTLVTPFMYNDMLSLAHEYYTLMSGYKSGSKNWLYDVINLYYRK